MSLGTIGAQKDGTSVEGGQYRSLVPNVNAVNAMHWFVKTESLWLFVLIILLLREKKLRKLPGWSRGKSVKAKGGGVRRKTVLTRSIVHSANLHHILNEQGSTSYKVMMSASAGIILKRQQK